MSIYKPPEGISDVGTFELKPQYIEDVDPYIAHYNKNQREESETAYRKWMAKKTGKPIDDIVYEPKLKPIASGAFTALSEFTTTPIFAQLIYYSLAYALVGLKAAEPSSTPPRVPLTRIETFLQVVLHLVLLAIYEDKVSENNPSQPSFIHWALAKTTPRRASIEALGPKTMVCLLEAISTENELKACHPKIALILKRMRQRRPSEFELAYLRLGIPVDRINTASPANTGNAEEEKERKKKAALDRQARVMAQFQQQQKSFLENQGNIDWGIVEDEDDVAPPPMEEQKNFWKYPSGTCILCQEKTDDRCLYGTFAFFTESPILRQTDLQDPDFVREAAQTPKNLDRSAEAIRPFGIARENRRQVVKVSAAGDVFTEERQIIGKGFPSANCLPGPVSIGCGHIMHYHCFEVYFEATWRRHQHQIARHHPEETGRLEFVCPLCKAIGNAFLPIIWKGKEESYPGVLNPSNAFAQFLDHQMMSAYYILGAARPPDGVQNSFKQYSSSSLLGNIADKGSYLVAEAWESSTQSVSGTPMSDSFPPAAVPALATSSRPRPTTPDSSTMVRELVAVYRRLRDALQKNNLEAGNITGVTDSMHNELCSSGTLARSVGFSISAVEIQQRGTDAEYGMTFLEKIPAQVLTHLRILSETVTSYTSVGGQRFGGENRLESEFRQDSERQHCQLFMAQYFGEETDHSRRPADTYHPLLRIDPFIFLSECVFGVVPAQEFDIHHIVRLCYLAEIVKVVYHVGRNSPVNSWVANLINRDKPGAALDNFAEFCLSVIHFDMKVRTPSGSIMDASILATDVVGDNQGFAQEGLDTLLGCYDFVKRYALVFLRKCIVLLYVRYGVDFNSRVSPAPELDELERLTEMLKVPTFDEMCTSLTNLGPQYGWPQTTKRLVEGWIRHDVLHPQRTGLQPVSAMVSHPSIFELVGLPKNYDHLLEECTRRRCPTTGKDVSDPLICLMCGDVFCGQGICCLKEEKVGRHRNPKKIGGAQQHMRK